MNQVPDFKVIFEQLHRPHIGQAIHNARTRVICTKALMADLLKRSFSAKWKRAGMRWVEQIEVGKRQISFEEFEQICFVLGELARMLKTTPITIESTLKSALNLRKIDPLPKVKAIKVEPPRVQSAKVKKTQIEEVKVQVIKSVVEEVTCHV